MGNQIEKKYIDAIQKYLHDIKKIPLNEFACSVIERKLSEIKKEAIKDISKLAFLPEQLTLQSTMLVFALHPELRMPDSETIQNGMERVFASVGGLNV